MAAGNVMFTRSPMAVFSVELADDVQRLDAGQSTLLIKGFSPDCRESPSSAPRSLSRA
jgi:hypothetical protein